MSRPPVAKQTLRVIAWDEQGGSRLVLCQLLAIDLTQFLPPCILVRQWPAEHGV